MIDMRDLESTLPSMSLKSILFDNTNYCSICKYKNKHRQLTPCYDCRHNPSVESNWEWDGEQNE